MSKLLNPRMWYLAGLGALALTYDAGRRRIRQRRVEGTQPSTDGRRGPVVIESSAMDAPPSKTTPAPARRPATSPTTSKGTVGKDDLTSIKGIGPAYARRLTDAGITTYSDLASASSDRLREITRAPAIAKPDDWIAQARSLSQ